MAILLVHHLRKMGDSDPLNKLSGTTGIGGGVDSTFIMDRSRKEAVAQLFRTGKSIQPREMELRFDETAYIKAEFRKIMTPYQGGNIRVCTVFSIAAVQPRSSHFAVIIHKIH